MLDITDAARSAIRVALNQSDAANGLRIVVAAGGCAGLQYRLGLAAGAEDGDAVKTFDDGLTVYVDPESATLLNGTTVDFVEDERGAGFVFDNPNAAGRCACSGGGC
ncbi:iron-sulfur cluster assembly accessory protein [Roseospira marina]|uniref:Iron-sulfur cluster assembly accessory protein n=1 Tax=Roseospira marina TaxID=140057 RepID=A0A5M6IIT8_9PROT|nr:iron-sulfur cluster assembly accessory protein [Roseospira marina]KAA5607615.1 iron-sulfur cluster assembly accessory protein [Roseospira marina]MBB4312188.1 iron-sulfur cluster assembly protein [Roseospira marina]MBB5085796.1 iron-sulfur cluster assembly protein [Roseospira marina]